MENEYFLNIQVLLVQEKVLHVIVLEYKLHIVPLPGVEGYCLSICLFASHKNHSQHQDSPTKVKVKHLTLNYESMLCCPFLRISLVKYLRHIANVLNIPNASIIMIKAGSSMSSLGIAETHPPAHVHAYLMGIISSYCNFIKERQCNVLLYMIPTWVWYHQ